MLRFEKLAVWERAIDFAARVYSTTLSFPDAERFGLTSQMRRAAVSISSNIAEGSGRSSDTDIARFIEIAYGSLMEVISQANIARIQRMLSQAAFEEHYREADELARMLSGLRSTLLARGKTSQSVSGSPLSTLRS